MTFQKKKNETSKKLIFNAVIIFIIHATFQKYAVKLGFFLAFLHPTSIYRRMMLSRIHL